MLSALLVAAAIAVEAPFGTYQVSVPEFVKRDFRIADYGAKADGTKCTDAIARAMADCESQGGGRIVVPAGNWLTGGVRLRSNCDLHLEDGAVLEFTDDPDDYLPAVRTSWEGVECFNYSPLISANDITNVAITGKGTLRARMGTWRSWGGVRKPKAEAAKLKLVREWGPKDVPVENRDLTKIEGSNLRPPFVGLNGCANVLLEGFRLRESPFWCIHVLHSDGVVLRGLDLKASINNSDGANFESTRNVLVENCTFDQGDDIVCCKAGLDRDGRRRGIPTENVFVRRCVAKGGHGLFTMGSECSGGIRNVAMEDCRVEGECCNVLNVKTREPRGGFIENVFLRHVRAASVSAAVVTVTARNDAWSRYQEGLERCLTRIDGICVEDVTVSHAARRLCVLGDPGAPIRRLSARNVTVGQIDAPDSIECADGVK